MTIPNGPPGTLTPEELATLRRLADDARAVITTTGGPPWSLSDYLQRRKLEPIDPKRHKKGKKGIDR